MVRCEPLLVLTEDCRRHRTRPSPGLPPPSRLDSATFRPAAGAPVSDPPAAPGAPHGPTAPRAPPTNAPAVRATPRSGPSRAIRRGDQQATRARCFALPYPRERAGQNGVARDHQLEPGTRGVGRLAFRGPRRSRCQRGVRHSVAQRRCRAARRAGERHRTRTGQGPTGTAPGMGVAEPRQRTPATTEGGWVAEPPPRVAKPRKNDGGEPLRTPADTTRLSPLWS